MNKNRLNKRSRMCESGFAQDVLMPRSICAGSTYAVKHREVRERSRMCESGFTLIEIMIAVAVFAVMSAMAYGGLNSVMKSRAGLDEHATRLSKMQKAFSIIERDIQQVVSRSIRDQYGDTKEALVSHDYEDIKLELTHTGWRNPFPSEKRVRSVLQRAGYTIKDEQLIRLYWFELDRGYESKPFESVLLDNIKSFELRFVDKNKQWQTQWPKLNSQEVIPQAVEVTIENERLGRVTRLFQVPVPQQ